MADLTANADQRKLGFIYETVEAAGEAMEGVPKNRTLLAADLTDLPASRPSFNYECETMEDVFENYRPSVKMEFTDADGGAVNEELSFKELGDFSKKAMTKQSDFLRALQAQADNYGTFAKRLQNNKVLQKVLNDPESKDAYITLLRSMLQDLEAKG